MIFLSYRREDSADVCGRINDRLAQHFGQESVFTDVDSIPLGLDFQKYIDERVGECDIFLVVIGRNWLSITDTDGRPRLQQPNDFVRIEVESALQRNIPVIPLLVQRADIPSADELPISLTRLATRNGMQIRPNPDFHRDMARLINGIETHLTTQSGEAKKDTRENQPAADREERQLSALKPRRKVKKAKKPSIEAGPKAREGRKKRVSAPQETMDDNVPLLGKVVLGCLIGTAIGAFIGNSGGTASEFFTPIIGFGVLGAGLGFVVWGIMSNSKHNKN